MNACKICGSPKIENRDTMLCGECNHAERKASREATKQALKPKPTRIRKVSEKRGKVIPDYLRKKAKFLKGKICPVYPEEPVVDCHHQKGRIGYADEWARSKGITLLMDQRYWLAVSRKGHDCIETHPSLARARGWSLSRTEIIQDKEETV